MVESHRSVKELEQMVQRFGNNALGRIVRLRVEVAGRYPERRYGKLKVLLRGPRANRATNAVELVGTSNKSEFTPESEMPGACLVVFHTAGAGGETDSTMRKCVHNPAPLPQPAALFRIAHGQPRQDLTGTQSIPNVLGVVDSVS
jgi:hypothetical protein